MFGSRWRGTHLMRDSEQGTVGPGAGGQAQVAVLVVDDDPDMTRFIGAVLQSRGHRSASAYDAIQGFMSAKRHHPKVVLVDWHMPEGGGPQLLRKLRESPDTSGIPVIVITSDSAPNIRGEAVALGARLFLHKPLDPDKLVEVVGTVLEGAR